MCVEWTRLEKCWGILREKVWLRLFSSQTFSRIIPQRFSNLVNSTHTYLPMKMKRVFRKVGIYNSDAGEVPRRKHTTRRTRRKFEIKHFVVVWPSQLQVCRVYCGLPTNVPFFGPAAVLFIFQTRSWSNGHTKSTCITQHVYSSLLATKTKYCAIILSRLGVSILFNTNSRPKKKMRILTVEGPLLSYIHPKISRQNSRVVLNISNVIPCIDTMYSINYSQQPL